MKKTVITALAAITMVMVSCDELSMKETIVSAPTIESFTPTEGYAGCEITVTGTSLNNVTSATIGGADATITQRISNTMIKIEVPSDASTGIMTLSNAAGKGESEEVFAMTYPSPEVTVPARTISTELGATLMFDGTKMSVINRVLFTATGYEPHSATILSKNDAEIVVTVPYVESNTAAVTFEYYNGATYVATPESMIPMVTIDRFSPKVTTTSFNTYSVGDIVTLEGEYLDKVEQVMVGGTLCIVTSKSESQLRFVVPNNDSFVDGDNVTTLRISYFDGVENELITDNFVVNVPYMLVWKDKKIYGQGRDVESLTSFFSPQTGTAYANLDWRAIDAVAYKYQGATCSAAQIPAVTEAEYNSVVPYFFFSGASAGTLQINSPAASATQLKNFYWQNKSDVDSRVTGSSGNCYGTAVLTFLMLNPDNEGHAAIINGISSGAIDRIDAETFPIDTDAKTCRGISISSLSSSVKDTTFAPNVFTVGQNKDTDVDAWLMVFYYNYKGVDSSNRSLNIKRTGLIHIKHINFVLYNNTNAPSSSSVTFDMYWMKHDYNN
jgi:hypothetical protein